MLSHRLGVELGLLRFLSELGFFFDRLIKNSNRVADTILAQAAGGTEPACERTDPKEVDDKDKGDGCDEGCLLYTSDAADE